LAAGGEHGVDKVLGLLADDVRRTMALLGVARIGELSTDYLEAVR
jgi:isopentenyl diphosphate isomerase/L-lactate dehydrogenase-like FMN-dependent dehydrogenase